MAAWRRAAATEFVEVTNQLQPNYSPARRFRHPPKSTLPFRPLPMPSRLGAALLPASAFNTSSSLKNLLEEHLDDLARLINHRERKKLWRSQS